MKILAIGLLILLMNIQLILAGNGSSGGGNLHGDETNPWFLQNTKNVTYCIDLDPEFSTLSLERIQVLIKNAFNFWIATFNKPDVKRRYSDLFKPQIAVATQEFTEVGCSNSTDIRFQLGTLNVNQRSRLGYSIDHIIGIAFRERYDAINLKGSGFIYIAPESGVFRPSSPGFAQNVWSYGNQNVLLFTLIHEIGHIFGLQDLNFNDDQWEIMGKYFVENITTSIQRENGSTNRFFEHIVNVYGYNYFRPLGYDGTYNGSTGAYYSSPETRLCDFLSVDCSQKKFAFKGKGRVIDFYTQKDSTPGDSAEETLVGSFDLNSGYPDFSPGVSPKLINVWLPKTQNVFTIYPSDLELTLYVLSSRWQGRIRNVVYRPVNGEERRVLIDFTSPISFQIGAVFDGEFFPNIFGN